MATARISNELRSAVRDKIKAMCNAQVERDVSKLTAMAVGARLEL